MTNEEQKAWDMFAAAALTGCLSSETKDYKYSKAELAVMAACKYADAMMEQRKARMG